MHVLVVDDNITIRQLISLTLKNASDIKATVVGTGAESLLLAKHTAFDLILIDWSMPKMHGEMLLTEMRKLALHHHTPIIILSADSHDDSKERARQLGADAWIVKPFHPVQLVDLIRQVVSEQRSA
jgi:two-component system chemotaxis response regulator CheY